MLEIRYFNRCKSDRFSIEKVTSSIANEISKKNNVISFDVPFSKFSLVNFFKNCNFVFKNRTRGGINHITGDIHYCILALIGSKSVLTIHDLVFLQDKSSRIKYIINYLLWLWLPVKLSSRVVCISERTKNDVLSHIRTNKISVINDPITMDVDGNACSEFNNACPRILHIGTKSNKNLRRTVKALVGINCHLVIIGKLNEEDRQFISDSGISFENKFDLSEAELVAEYEKAHILSFLSTFEGFGMPIVEGQLSKCVVITSNIEPMTEVGGKAAFYVNPFDVNDIHNGFLKIINDEEVRNVLLSMNLENAARFSPRRIAAQYESLYLSLK